MGSEELSAVKILSAQMSDVLEECVLQGTGDILQNQWL